MKRLEHHFKNLNIYPSMPKLQICTDWWGGTFSGSTSHSFIYVLDGAFAMHIEDHYYIVKKHQLVLIPAGYSYACWRLPGMPLRIVTFSFYAECEDEELFAFFDTDSSGHVVYLPDQEAEIMEIYDRMMAPPGLVDNMPKTILVCAEIARLCAIYMQARIAHANAKIEFHAVIAYMREHLKEDIPLETLADSMHLNPAYFSAKFKEQMMLSPMKYLAEMRAKEAAKLLRDTQLPETAIGSKIGFSNVYNFRIFFERQMGIRPAKYREMFLPKPGHGTN